MTEAILHPKFEKVIETTQNIPKTVDNHQEQLVFVKKQIHKMKTRNPKKFVVNSACTERYSKSSVPAMQRLLNEHDKKFNDMISSLCPVTNENCQTGSLIEKI